MRPRPEADPAEADWWGTSRGSGTPPAVGFLVPRGFEAYARVLHPAVSVDGTLVRWAAVAEECGTRLHPQAQWWRLAGRSDVYAHHGTWAGENPSQGVLEPLGFTALADVLARHTTTPERTVVAFWVGYGVWPAEWTALPTSPGPGRESYLFERPLGDVPALCSEATDGPSWQTPSAWWPADRADERLEVLPWPADGSLWSDADTVNR